jgi:hypothetical protein
MPKKKKVAAPATVLAGLIHRHFGAVAIVGDRVTQGGHDVVDAITKDGREIVLLADPKYWVEKKRETSSDGPREVSLAA